MDGAFITLTFPTITAGASTYTAKTGSYSAQIYGDLTFEASYHKAYSFFSIPVNENVSEVTVTYYMYMKESTAGSVDAAKTYVEGKLYIKYIFNFI